MCILTDDPVCEKIVWVIGAVVALGYWVFSASDGNVYFYWAHVDQVFHYFVSIAITISYTVSYTISYTVRGCAWFACWSYTVSYQIYYSVTYTYYISVAITAVLPVYDEGGVWTDAVAHVPLGQFEYVPLTNSWSQALGSPLAFLPPHVSPWPSGY